MKTDFTENIKPYAVVFSLDSINGLQTARILSSRGIPVIGIASDPSHPCCKTNTCQEIIKTNTQREDLITALEILGGRLSNKAVLFPCNNIEVLLVSRNLQKLKDFYHIVLPDHQTVEMLLLKDKFYTYAIDENLPIPRTYILENREDAEQASKNLIFPCILKPIIKDEIWELHNPFKAYKAYTTQEFMFLYDQCQNWSNQLVVQEWIEGPDTNLYTCYTYFGADNKLLVTFVTQKLRQWPPEIGEGCLGVECRNDLVLENTVHLFENVHLRGMGYLEMKCDSRTGNYYIVEPNIGRPTSKSSLAEAGDVELTYTMYCDALGLDLPKHRTQKYGDAKWIFLRRDFTSAFYYWRRHELTISEWWRSLKGIKIYALFSWHDPAPFWFDLIISVRRYLSLKERKQKNFKNPFLNKI